MNVDFQNLSSGLLGAALGTFVGGIVTWRATSAQIKNDRTLLLEERRAKHRDTALRLLGNLKSEFRLIRFFNNSWNTFSKNEAAKSSSVLDFQNKYNEILSIYGILDSQISEAWDQLIILLQEYSVVMLDENNSARIEQDVMNYIDFVGKYIRSATRGEPIMFQKRPYLKRESNNSWEFPEIDEKI